MSKKAFQFHKAALHVQLTLVPQADLEWNQQVELSVDDPIEQRLDRTVQLGEDPDNSFNRSTQENYPGWISGFESGWQANGEYGEGRICKASYHCQLPFAQFMDTREQMESSKSVTWARAKFRIQCHTCSAKTDFSSQTNEVFPRELRCACGVVLGKVERKPLIEAESV